MQVWTPRNYQVRAIIQSLKELHLQQVRKALFMEPGLGKTSTTLALLNHLKHNDYVTAMLVVVPLRPFTAWKGQIKEWSSFKDLTISVLHGNNKQQALETPADIYLINPEGLKWLVTNGLKKLNCMPFNMLVVDESSEFRNPGKRWKQLVSLLPWIPYRLILTGTSTPKHYADLWAQIYLLDEGEALGKTIGDFRNEFMIKGGFKGRDWVLRKGVEPIILERIKHLCISLTVKDHLDMPDLIVNDIRVDLPPTIRTQYTQMERFLFAEFENGGVLAKAAGSKSNVCHQIANGTVYHDQNELAAPLPSHKRDLHILHNEKLDTLVNLVRELQGAPLLVVYHFKHDLVRIRQAFSENGLPDPPYIGSGVSPQQSEHLEHLWNSGKIPVLLLNPASCAFGLNLQKAGNDICFFSLIWRLDFYIQIIQRLWRQGVNGAVRVHRIIATDTVDEVMIQRVGYRHRNLQELHETFKMDRDVDIMLEEYLSSKYKPDSLVNYQLTPVSPYESLNYVH